MLSKLIRYEWKAVARVCIPMYGGLILAAMLTHFLLGNLERFSSTLYDIITMAMSTLCFGLFMAAFGADPDHPDSSAFPKICWGTRDT